MSKIILVSCVVGLVAGVVGGVVAKLLGIPDDVYGYLVGGLAGGASAVVVSKMQSADA